MENTKKISLCIFAFTNCIALSTNASVVINEIDYDQPGTDTAEFIELYNTSHTALSLEHYTIDLINGSNSSSYRTIDLSGFDISANGFFVVCSNTSLVANCDYSFTSTNGWFQNGAPDAVALYDGASLIDSVSYEGSLAPYTEGDPLIIKDNNTDIISLSRIINGIDSNNNIDDFQLSCITPGSVNIAGMGDCSSISVSAVPVPAAAWLFGSGIIGLIGLARRS